MRVTLGWCEELHWDGVMVTLGWCEGYIGMV